MSAIWGAVSFSDPLKNNLSALMETPYKKTCKIDHYSDIIQPKVYFGCGIQYITEEALLEKMPFHNVEKKIYFSSDCLLDNREELIQALGASPSEPDGTLMYLAFLKWGIDCVKYFRGLFSLAVYNETEKNLYLAADQTASRCLYYCQTENTILFSTLMAPILAVCPSISYNENYLKDYLTAPGLMPNISANETPYTGIYKLKPGTYLKLTADTVSEISYWDPSVPLKDCHCRNAKEYGRYFRELYASCVHDALRCRGEIGVAMSSGLDSATVGALAADHLRDSSRQLQTYTYIPYMDITDQHNPNNITNEQADVESIIAMHPNMIPHFLNNNGRNCLESLDENLRIMEFPFKAYVNMPNLCEIYNHASADNCKVLLTGQFGNSTVSHGYIDDVLYDLYSSKHWICFLNYLNHYSKTVKESRKKALKGCINYFRYSNTQYQNRKFNYKPSNTFLGKDIMTDYPMEERYTQNGITIFENIPIPHSYYQSGLYKAAMHTYLGEWETKMGLAHGIIIRDATKDIRMLSFCYHLPYRYFAYGGTPRWLIRENMKGLLPEHLLNNWMRYGVQNADYLNRINRDFKEIQPMLHKVLEPSPMSPWLNIPEITAYLEELSDTGIDDDFVKFDSLIYLVILCEFYSLPKF